MLKKLIASCTVEFMFKKKKKIRWKSSAGKWVCSWKKKENFLKENIEEVEILEQEISTVLLGIKKINFLKTLFRWTQSFEESSWNHKRKATKNS